MKRISKVIAALLISFVVGCTVQRDSLNDIPVITQESDIILDNLDYGIPGKVDVILDREGFATGFLKEKHQPAWVCYRLTSKKVGLKLAARTNKFAIDPILLISSATPGDYTRSGYDRGHMAPAADMSWSSKAMKNSFYMTNMSPQVPMFNRGVWRELESWVRQVADKEGSIIVVSGTIFSEDTTPKTIGMRGVEVPVGYWKAILSEKPPIKTIGFILPNAATTNDISTFACSVDAIEEKVKIDLFRTLPQVIQDDVEKRVEFERW